MLIEILLLVVLVFFIYHSWRRSYWSRRGVFTVPGEFIFGNTRRLLFGQIAFAKYFDDIYRKHKNEKLIGFYNFFEPMLLITDPSLILQVFISDYQSFPYGGHHVSKKRDPLISINPFMAYGDEWKARRGIQVAIQTQSKLKENIPLMKQTAKTMCDYIKENISKPLKVSEISSYYTIDNVTSTAFGIEPTAFKDPSNSFRQYAGREIFDPKVWLTMILTLLNPFLYDLLRLRFVSKETQDFFIEMARRIYTSRKDSQMTRNDLVDQLLKLDIKREAEGKPGLDMEEVAGHMMTAYMDSVETSSAFLSYILLEMANRPELQTRLRSEFTQAFPRGLESDLDYEKIGSLVYLNMVFNEILRLHPLLGFFVRLCMKTTKLGDVVIDKGTLVFIPYSSLVNDPDYFPDPENFNPERFSPENAKMIVKGTFFPFGEGPKQCLGMKYAALQIKLAVVYIVMNFKLIPVSKSGKIEEAGPLKVLTKPKDTEQVIFESL